MVSSLAVTANGQNRPYTSGHKVVCSEYCPLSLTYSRFSLPLPLPFSLSFNFLFYYGCSFFICSPPTPFLHQHLSPSLQSDHSSSVLPPSVSTACRPAGKLASSAESTMAGPFCSRSHASLISLSYSLDGIGQQVHGALYCSCVNQAPLPRLRCCKSPGKWPGRGVHCGLYCSTLTFSEPTGIFAQEKHSKSTWAHPCSALAVNVTSIEARNSGQLWVYEIYDGKALCSWRHNIGRMQL